MSVKVKDNEDDSMVKKKKLVIRSTARIRDRFSANPELAKLWHHTSDAGGDDDGDDYELADDEELEEGEGGRPLNLTGTRVVSHVRGPKDESLPVPDMTDTMFLYVRWL